MSFPQWWYLFFNLFKIFSTTWNMTFPVGGQLGFPLVCEKLFCLCAFCQRFFFSNVVSLTYRFHGFLLRVWHLRLLLVLSARSSVHLVERQLGHFRVGELLLTCGWLHEGCPGMAAASPGAAGLQENLSAIFWRQYLGGFCFPCTQRLFPPHKFVSIPQMPWLPFPSRAHVTAPAPKFPPHLRVVPSAFPAPALALGFLHRARLVPPIPTPALAPGSRKPNAISAGLLESKDKGYFKAQLCSFFSSWVTSTQLNFALC